MIIKEQAIQKFNKAQEKMEEARKKQIQIMQQECNRFEQVTISEKLREFRLRKSKKNTDLISAERRFIQRKKSEKKSETF